MKDAGVPDLTAAAQFGEPRLIYTWSEAMIAGDTTANALESTAEWTAPFLTADGTPLGTYRVWRPPEKVTAEMAGYNNDVELARNLASMPSEAYLVHEAPTESWFGVEDGIVSPLGQLAAREVPEPISVERLTPIIAKRSADAMAGPGINIGLLVGTILIVGAVAGATIILRRRRRRVDT